MLQGALERLLPGDPVSPEALSRGEDLQFRRFSQYPKDPVVAGVDMGQEGPCFPKIAVRVAEVGEWYGVGESADSTPFQRRQSSGTLR